MLAYLALLRSGEAREQAQSSAEAPVCGAQVVGHAGEASLGSQGVGALEVLVVGDQVDASLLLRLDVVLERAHHFGRLCQCVTSKQIECLP